MYSILSQVEISIQPLQFKVAKNCEIDIDNHSEKFFYHETFTDYLICIQYYIYTYGQTLPTSLI